MIQVAKGSTYDPKLVPNLPGKGDSKPGKDGPKPGKGATGKFAAGNLLPEHSLHSGSGLRTPAASGSKPPEMTVAERNGRGVFDHSVFRGLIPTSLLVQCFPARIVGVLRYVHLFRRSGTIGASIFAVTSVASPGSHGSVDRRFG